MLPWHALIYLTFYLLGPFGWQFAVLLHYHYWRRHFLLLESHKQRKRWSQNRRLKIEISYHTCCTSTRKELENLLLWCITVTVNYSKHCSAKHLGHDNLQRPLVGVNKLYSANTSPASKHCAAIEKHFKQHKMSKRL